MTMQNHRLLILLILSIIASINVIAQGVPLWLKGELPPQGNDTYYFSVTHGSGVSALDAQKDADLSLIVELMNSAGIKVTGTRKAQMSYYLDSQKIIESQSYDFDYKIDLDSVRISFKAVDRYITKDKGVYNAAVLYEVARNPDKVQYDPVEYTRHYGLRPLWRSAIIPGWGQMYKKQYIKGSVILAMEAAAISIACVADNQRSSYMGKIRTETDMNAIRFYQNKANHWKNMRNAFFIGAGAIYVYNIVDAIASKGRPIYKKPSRTNFVIGPVVTADKEYGLAMTITF